MKNENNNNCQQCNKQIASDLYFCDADCDEAYHNISYTATQNDTATQDSKRVYYVLRQQLEVIKDKFAKLQKRAVKLNIEAPTYEIVDVKDVANKISLTFDSYTRYYVIAVTTAEVKLADYSLIAIIEHDDADDKNSANIIHKISTDSTANLEMYRNADAYCQHCNTTRRRSQTFLIKHADSQALMQVGRSCLADFISDTRTAEHIINSATMHTDLLSFMSDEADFAFNNRTAERIDVKDALTVCAALIRTYDYVATSQASATMPSTRQRLAKAFNFTKTDKYENSYTITEIDTQTATEALQYAQQVSGNDFLNNISAVAMKQTVKEKHFGLLSAIVPAYLREMQRLNELQRKQANNAVSNYVDAEINDMINFDNVTVTFVRFIDNDFGGSYIIKFLTQDNNILTTFASASSAFINCKQDDFIKVNDTFNIRCKIKNFEIYNDEKQTVISHVKCRS